jgi:hypothetical protein
MVGQKHDPSGRGAGWVVAAIVAVVAICAVSFMITQRPQEAIAVAEGDPLTGDRAPQVRQPGGAANTVRVAPPDGADTGRLAPDPGPPPPPRAAWNANAAASNANAVEPAH